MATDTLTLKHNYGETACPSPSGKERDKSQKLLLPVASDML